MKNSIIIPLKYKSGDTVYVIYYFTNDNGLLGKKVLKKEIARVNSITYESKKRTLIWYEFKESSMIRQEEEIYTTEKSATEDINHSRNDAIDINKGLEETN